MNLIDWLDGLTVDSGVVFGSICQLVEQEIKRELEQEKQALADGTGADAISSDVENDEEEYEAWKLRELKRIKRDRDERDQ